MQSQIKTINSVETVVGRQTKVIRDPKSKARVMNFPFDFPDDEKGVVIICRIKDDEWTPSDDISSVVIVFNDKKGSEAPATDMGGKARKKAKS